MELWIDNAMINTYLNQLAWRGYAFKSCIIMINELKSLFFTRENILSKVITNITLFLIYTWPRSWLLFRFSVCWIIKKTYRIHINISRIQFHPCIHNNLGHVVDPGEVTYMRQSESLLFQYTIIYSEL